MSVGWEVKELGAVSAISYGHTESASGEPVGPRFLRITDIQHDHVDWDSVPYCRIETPDLPKYLLANGDIVFARTGATTGKSFLVTDPPEAVFASYLIRLRLLDKNVLPEFVSLFFQTSGYWKSIKDGSTGSAQGGFNATKLGALSIPIPPVPEQKRIVGILDEAFDGIATAKANTQKNLHNAGGVFESYLQSIFTHRGPDWVDRTIEEVCVIGDGNHSSNYPKKEELVDVGVPFIRATNLVAGRISGKEMRFLSPQKHVQLKKGHLKTGDVLITNRGEIGKTAMVDVTYDNANLNSQIAWLRCREEIDNKFLFHILNSGEIQKHFQSSKNGAALQQLTIKQLRALRVPLPPKDAQQAIVGQLDSLEEKTQRLESIYEQKLTALEELKKSLLHQAFSGQL